MRWEVVGGWRDGVSMLEEALYSQTQWQTQWQLQMQWETQPQTQTQTLRQPPPPKQ